MLRGPFRLLYVLHTPRCEAAPGRYESPEVSVEQVRHFFRRFSDFLAADGRFDLWVHSATDHATLVWDRHDQLFGYGPVDLFVSRLREMGFVTGRVEVPVPHEHHYREEMDVHAADLLTAFDWCYSPLRPEDEQ